MRRLWRQGQGQRKNIGGAAAALVLIALIGVSGYAAPNAQSVTFQDDVFDLRADIELLADQQLGANTRPPGWTGTITTDSPSFVADLWVDNELLADAVFGAGVRPPEWIGVTVSVAGILARNVRHDVELTADQVFGGSARPQEWRGSRIETIVCNRTLQNVLTVIGQFYGVESTTPDSALNYCAAVEAEIEDELIEIVFALPENRIVPETAITEVRADLDLLTTTVLGTLPEGYIGEVSRDSPTYAADILLDLETLANADLGVGIRPPGWTLSIPNNPANAYLTLRRNLELLADATAGVGVRPEGWRGADALERCEPLLRNLSLILGINYPQFTLETIDVNAPDYCAQISSAVNSFVENPPVLDIAEEAEEVRRFSAEADYAFTYLDVAATLYMGTMPPGIPFRAVYRNYNESTMMFVTGSDFALYIDRRFTSLPETTFRALPTFNGATPVAYCDAFWCSGPGPTPTPFGSSPLLQVLFNTTPVAPPNPQELQQTKQLVSWNYIRVTYLNDNVAARSAQVALEICPAPAAGDVQCEPVLSVFDNSTGVDRPAISQVNGLNVYDFRYGYSQNVVIEGETLFSQDIWISDPTIR
ncbi:MAG: hypothetical protein SF162_11325 [bacterium]|nr:hypothetical protein [bacterium]